MKYKKEIVEKIGKLRNQQQPFKNIGDMKEIEKLEISIQTLQWVINEKNRDLMNLQIGVKND